jgi:hypothetical protein
MTNARQETHLIAFDLHPAAPSETTLPAFQFVIDEFKVDTQVGRKSFNNGY